MNKRTILFMAQLPPPVHGAALRNKSLLDSELLNNEFTSSTFLFVSLMT
jgi:hypothetical protein